MTTHRDPLNWGETDAAILLALSRHSCMTYAQIIELMSLMYGKNEAQTKKRLIILRKRELIKKASRTAPYQITLRGLNAIGSELPEPSIEGNTLNAHHATVVHLVITFETRVRLRLHTERELNCEHAPPHLSLLSKDPLDPNEWHRPDFAIEHPDGTLIAVEYERTAKSRVRTDRVIGAHERNSTYQKSVYITTQATSNPISDAITRTRSTRVHQISLDEVYLSLYDASLPSVFSPDGEEKRAA
jgi:hypothetical protein